MKNKLITTNLLLVTSILLFQSCSKKIDEAYTQPNATYKPPIEELLPNAVNALCNPLYQLYQQFRAPTGWYVRRTVCPVLGHEHSREPIRYDGDDHYQQCGGGL